MAEKSMKGKTLVIVESPAKAKTLKKILGANYEIKASSGAHSRPAQEPNWREHR
jgi:Topoisomerase IA